MLVNPCSGTRTRQILGMQADVCPDPATCRCSANFGHGGAKFGAESGTCWSESTAIGSMLSTFRENFANFSPESADVWQTSAACGQTRTKIGRFRQPLGSRNDHSSETLKEQCSAAHPPETAEQSNGGNTKPTSWCTPGLGWLRPNGTGGEEGPNLVYVCSGISMRGPCLTVVRSVGQSCNGRGVKRRPRSIRHWPDTGNMQQHCSKRA